MNGEETKKDGRTLELKKERIRKEGFFLVLNCLWFYFDSDFPALLLEHSCSIAGQ